MSGRRALSTFDLMIMLALVRLGDEAYGVPIAREIEAHGRRSVALSTVYAALERLAERGFVSSDLGEPTPERGGRAKRFFRITATGLREVRETQRVFAALAQRMPKRAGETA